MCLEANNLAFQMKEKPRDSFIAEWSPVWRIFYSKWLNAKKRDSYME